ncbi:hypothetical protein Scep_014295 [Stephania cephalantha]|uniref:Uncharacterized protein n=1 Tax=Stephania cephalantha TaxID=152367 RepID=A0AAP0J0Z5_9MAGN
MVRVRSSVSLVREEGMELVRFAVRRKVRSPTAAGNSAEMFAEKMVRAEMRLVSGSHSRAYQLQQSVFGTHEAKW